MVHVGSTPTQGTMREVHADHKRMENKMPSKPRVLDVNSEAFKPTPKYYSSAAMVLDTADYDISTGDTDWLFHIQAFWNVKVEDAYNIVSEYIAHQQFNQETWVSWLEAKQMIDILVEGRNWLVYTDSVGFVMAECHTELHEAKAHFDAQDELYSKWLGDDE